MTQRSALRVAITRWVDDHQPGFVECEFVDYAGRTWTFVEKAPVVTTEHLNAESIYPLSGEIECTLIRRSGDDAAEVETDVIEGALRVRTDQLIVA